MRRRNWNICLIFVAGALLTFSLAGLAAAQTGGGYDLSWHTIAAGGWTFSTGGGYSLGGTAGQVNASLMHGGAFTLAGGFWGGGTGGMPAGIHVSLPLILRKH